MFLFVFVGYLIGSVSFARVVAYFFKVDISKVGSGNPGATNVVRTLGKCAGILVFLGDFFKAFTLVVVSVWLGPIGAISGTDLGIFAMLGVILGHSFPIFFKFKGGKGVSTAMGGVSALTPGTAVIGILLWFVIFHATGFVSVASLFFAMSLPVTSFAFGYDMHSVALVTVMSLVIFLRHRSNIVRLWNGSEHRFEKK
ncbi:MAG: glycerol-3-phosphate 1-O-acyltransferase PlsY [Puniceicoccales bacterium]|nr:glycerol-3-phosphate 1-O-acyltransferase PlsY [Puniceicoccales bacterium]